MDKQIKKAFFLLLGFVLLVGCSTYRQGEIYDLSYDQTYLMTVDVLDGMDPWMLHGTDQKNGMITIGYDTYLTDHETEISFIVKRISPFETAVEIYDRKPSAYTEQSFTALDERFKTRPLTHPS